MFPYMRDSTFAFQSMAKSTLKNLFLFKKGFKNKKQNICVHETSFHTIN